MGHKHSFAYSINSKRQIVGCLRNNLNYGCSRGFRWKNGIMYDLNKLIPPGQNVNTFGSTPHRVNVHTDWYVRY